MNSVIERVFSIYRLMRDPSPDGLAASRNRIAGYIEKLNSAGQFTEQQLAMYGLAYLIELHEGRDPRFTGC